MQFPFDRYSSAYPHQSGLCDYIRYLEMEAPSADLQTMLGMAYLAQGDACRAIRAFQEAIRMDGRHFFAHLRYGDLLYRVSSLDAARQASERALLLARGVTQWRMAREQLNRIQDSLEGTASATRCNWWEPAWTFLFALFSLVATLYPRSL